MNIYTGAVVVVPTRNRAQLAMNAINSVLNQPVEILVSDNSTSERDRDELKSFCATVGETRLSYIRPPQSLGMPDHWQWAIEQALANYSASHFTYLTDRMMFRTGGFREVLDIAAVYPDRVITYNHDRICDNKRPIRVEEYEVTEKLLEVDSPHLLELCSEAILHHGLPRMLNCIVPRRVLEELRNRFGNVFSSIAPDFNFCFRCLDLEDSILFYDKSPMFHYALDRSLGATGTRGESTPELTDFESNLPVDSVNRNYATQIPSLITATNAVFNEYLVYKQQTQSPRFPDVNLQNYLRANATEVAEVSDPQLRAQTFDLLVKHGYVEQNPGNASLLGSVVGKLRRVMKKAPPPVQTPVRTFESLDEAIHYLRDVSRGNPTNWTWGAEILQGRELPLATLQQASR